MGKYKMWTMEEEIYVAKYYNRLTTDAICKDLDKNLKQLYRKKYQICEGCLNGEDITDQNRQKAIEGIKRKYSKREQTEVKKEERYEFIIKNHENMTIKEMANALGAAYSTVAKDRARLIDAGKINENKSKTLKKQPTRKKKTLKKIEIAERIPAEVIAEQRELKRKIATLDGNLKLGKKYKIKQLNKDGSIAINKKYVRHFQGTLVNINKNFYEFCSTGGYRECFLKKDFVIEAYKIKEA